MDRKTKIIFAIITVISALYAMSTVFGITSIESGTGGIIYRLIIIVTLLFSCSLAFIGLRKETNSAIIAGALGLGMLFIFEVYSFIYIFLLKGEYGDITINNYIRSCSYLLFITATIYLTPPVFKTHKILRLISGILSSCVVASVFYAVITNNLILLLYSSIAIKISCIIAATILYLRTPKCHPARLFSVPLRIICFLETIDQILIFYGNIWYLREIIITFYPAMYLLIGYAFLKLCAIPEMEVTENE